MSIYNNGDYLENNPTWHIEDSPWKAEQVFDILQKNKMDVKTVSEIGCGLGEVLLNLKKKLPADVNFAGYEISNDAYYILQHKSTENAKFVLEDLLQESNKDYFDLLLVMDVIEHVENYMEFLRKCKQKAKYKIFHVPLDFTVQKALRPSALLHNRQKVGHINYFTKEVALSALTEAGYKIIDYNYTMWGLELPQKSFLKKIGRLPLFLLTAISKDLAARLLGGCSVIILAE